jgi:hypothetical protein
MSKYPWTSFRNDPVIEALKETAFAEQVIEYLGEEIDRLEEAFGAFSEFVRAYNVGEEDYGVLIEKLEAIDPTYVTVEE